MTLIILFIVGAAGVALWWRGWTRAGWASCLAALALFISIGCGPAVALLLQPLQSGFSSESAVMGASRAVIVVLGAGTATDPSQKAPVIAAIGYGRVTKAAELYRSCAQQSVSCVVLISGGDPQRHGASEASVYATALTALGVPPKDQILEEHSLNTWQNAQFSSALLRAQAGDRIYLVSSGVHLRRSELYFAHFGVQAIPVRGDYEEPIGSLVPLAYNLAFADLALHEYVGLARFHVYEWLGLNGKSE
jgi:uncharacterized SAM-binding protein YcdF (DUF218 family)